MTKGESSLLRRTCLGLPVAIVLACLCAPLHAQPYQTLPVDEAGEVPEFVAWRDGFIDAVRRRDIDAVVALADPNIQLSVFAAAGRDTLRAFLDGEDGPWTGEVYWQALEDVLALGGTWRDFGDGARHFCAPYTFNAELPPEVQEYAFHEFDVAIVIQPDAPLHRGPDAREPIVAILNYDILQIVESREDFHHPGEPYWMSVRTTDGAHEGWIESTAARSPVDYRACFTQADSGGWVWEAFIAGD